MNSRNKKWLWIVLRILVTAGLMAFVIQMIQFRDIYHVTRTMSDGSEKVVIRRDVVSQTRNGGKAILHFQDGLTSAHDPQDITKHKGFISLVKGGDKRLYLLLLPALVVPVFLQALKWWVLLRGNGLDLSLRRVFYVTYAGVFFNNFLVGSMGGDFAQGVLATYEEERKAAIVGTLILNRLIGLAVMIVTAAACVTPFVGRLEDNTHVYVIYGLLGGLILGYFTYFNPSLRRWLGNRLPSSQTIRELDRVLSTATEKKRLSLVAAALALPAQAASILIVFGLGQALNFTDASLWDFFILMPIIFIITALPISIGGWGIQEAAYAYFFAGFTGMSTNEAIALSLFYKFSLIIMSVPGAIAFALGSTRKRLSVATRVKE